MILESNCVSNGTVLYFERLIMNSVHVVLIIESCM
jgi:hypothetical protein